MGGVECPDKSDPATIAKMTVQTLDRCLPPAMPGVTFLSGGISEEDSSIYLNEINKLQRKGAFALTFSYSRALQSSCIKIWGGKDEKYADAHAQRRARAGQLRGVEGRVRPGLAALDRGVALRQAPSQSLQSVRVTCYGPSS